MQTELICRCRASATMLASTAEVLATLPAGAIPPDLLAQTAAALDAIGGHLDRLIDRLGEAYDPQRA